MLEGTTSRRICPYLGLAEDTDARFSFPEAAHRCFATNPETVITLEHQSAFCFGQQHATCSRFTGEAAVQQPLKVQTPLSAGDPQSKVSQMPSPWWLMIWGTAIIFAIVLVILAAMYFVPQTPATEPLIEVVAITAPAPTASKTPEAEALPPEPDDRERNITTPFPVQTPTPVPDGRIYTVSPGEGDIGWVVSSEDRGNHFGDSFLYAGIFEDQIYTSAFQFDLSSIPRGAPIYDAFLQITGLRDDRLGKDGTWMARILEPNSDLDWRRQNYQDVFNTPPRFTLNPILGSEDLAPKRPNIFEFTPAQLRFLTEKIVNDEKPKILFRLDGPLTGDDNLFAWDTGYGPKSEGNKVTLILNVGPPPSTPPPFGYVLVTSTPTPENIATAAVIILQVTADATKIGTATPPPPNMVTPTPIPDYLIITPTPTPENEATAQTLAVIATAYTLLTGTPTPFSTYAVTATPSPTGTPTPTYVIITPTPTPESLLMAATEVAKMIAERTRVGSPTPLPQNWVTPFVVTATPSPANNATAQAISILATAMALTTGTPEPLPANAQTATPTPTYVIITSTPTSDSPFIAATKIAELQQQGFPKPLPENWVTPFVVTATPTPVNNATAQALSILATVQAFTIGTSTPMPDNVQTATPTPVFNLIELVLPPTPIPIALPTAETVPEQLLGKILFLSNREGPTDDGQNREGPTNEGQPSAYVYDPNTGQLGRLTDIWPYRLAQARDAWSADKRFRAFTKDMTRYKNEATTGKPIPENVPAVFWHDSLYNVENRLTNFGAGIAYGGAWSPTKEQITFISNESNDDEIWIVNRDGSGLTQLTDSNVEFNAREIGKDTFIPEINKHPSFSPDGEKIVFYSTQTGNSQLWIMNTDGTEQRLLMDWTPYYDWDPVWVKYLDTPPPLPGQ